MPLSGGVIGRSCQRSRDFLRVRSRADLCNSLGTRATTPGAENQTCCKPDQNERGLECKQFQQSRFRHDGRLDPSRKELARWWYRQRRSGTSPSDEIKGQKERKVLPAEEGQGTRSFNLQRSGRPCKIAQVSREGWGPHSCIADYATCRETGAKNEASEEPEQIEKQFGVRRSNLFKDLKPSWEQSDWACKGNCSTSSFEKEDVQKAPQIRTTVRGRGRGRAGRRWEAASSSRVWEADQLGKTKVITKSALPSVSDLICHSPEEVRRECATNSPRAVHQACLDQGDWSLAWLLTHQTNVWERRAWGGTAEELGNVAAYLKSMETEPACRESPQQSSTMESFFRRGGSSLNSCPQKYPQKREERPRERERRRQTGNIRSVDCPKSAVNPDVAKPASVNSVLEALQGGHGSFSRFLKLLHEKP